MQLARATTNIISSLILDKHNIIWRPSGGLLDCAFFETDYRYYLQPIQNPVFKNPSNRTAVTLPSPFFEDNTYNLIVTNDLKDRTPQDSLQRHINNVIVINTMRPPNMKREDHIILSQNTAKRTKIFMNDHIRESWGDMPNSHVIDYGVPLDILTTEDIEQKADVLIHDTSMLGKQIAATAQQEGLTTEVVSQFTSFEEFCEKVKKHKVYLDTTINGNYESLCAVALGAKVLATNSCKMTTPTITIENNGANILNKIKELLASDKTDLESSREYLDQNYNFEKFKQAVTQLFTSKIQEAYIA